MCVSFAAGLFAVVYLLIFTKGNVELDPGITIHPAPSVVLAKKNSPLLLNCSASSSPDAGRVSFTWYKDGEPVLFDRRVQVKDNGSLYFKQVKNNRHSRNQNRNQNGFYECFMKNKYGTVIARQVQLLVESISKSFTIEPGYQKVELGGVARFKCQIDGIPLPIYVWNKNSSSLPQNSRYITISSGILQIHNLSESDSGSFHCSVYQSFNQVNNGPKLIGMTLQHSRSHARLIVITDTKRRPPKIVAISREINATIKHSVTLECLADGNPSPVVTWMKDGNQTSDDNFNKNYDGSNLKFIEVNMTDAGTYQCVASSPGFPDAVAETQLNVKVPPFIIEAPLSKGYPVARWFRLKCIVGGIPSPKVTWYKNGQKIESLENMKIYPDNMLMIDSSIGDSGYYQCIAKNDVGVDMAIARLQFFLKDNVPKPPSHVTVTSVTSTEVCIRWFPSEYPKCCRVLAYTVVYGEPNDVTQKKVTPWKDKCIQNLKPQTYYKFYIRAFNSKGAGAKSDTVTVKTLESVLVAVSNLRLSSSSPCSMDLKWDPLPPEICDGVVTRYQIYVSNGGHDIMKNVSTADHKYTIRDLHPDTEYKVGVLAGKKWGYPKRLDVQLPWLVHRTPEQNDKSKVDEAAPNVRLSSSSPFSIDIEWDPVLPDKCNGVNIGYQVYVSNEGHEIMENVSATNQSYTIRDLLPETTYKIRVLSGTTDGYPKLLDEQWPWLIHRTPKDNKIPQVNVHIQVSQLNLTCVDVKWNITDNQPAISYKIDISNSSARTVEIQNIKMTNYIICGLDMLDKNLLLPFMLGTKLEP
ncbi:protogenin-like isoform X2 [Mytilus trossulus]|uniref:protogenin-like isoform X2 n=1 Tax=Mytilus trossulus TaxID=6551 RepID=UPI003006A601